MELIVPDICGNGFVHKASGKKFIPWGVNYDHDDSGRLIEDYWYNEWSVVEEDFEEMKSLGVNIVRVHLQVSKFMNTPTEPNQAALDQLIKLLKLAESTGLYLDITGLGCYHKQDVPAWYDKMNETQRWDVQACFWRNVARVCSQSNVVFCYDLMNEPVPPGKKKETQWLLEEFAGKYFVQRISLDLAGRSREEVAKAWVDRLVSEIRQEDKHHMVTVGVIPWAMVFPKAKPLFYSKQVSEKLDFVSVHFYPKKDQVNEAVEALSVYDIGKPLLIEEMFPLECSPWEMKDFIRRSVNHADGWVSFYWGKTIEEYKQDDDNLKDAIVGGWLTDFKDMKSEIHEMVHKSNSSSSGKLTDRLPEN